MLNSKVLFLSTMLYLIFFNFINAANLNDTITTTPETTTTTRFQIEDLMNYLRGMDYSQVNTFISYLKNMTISDQISVEIDPVYKSFMYYYMIYMSIAIVLLFLRKLSFFAILEVTTMGFMKYIFSTIYRFIALCINKANYRRLKRVVTHVVVPPTSGTLNLRKAMVQSGPMDDDPAIIKAGPSQGQSVAPATDQVQPQGNDEKVDKPVNQHVDQPIERLDKGDMEQNTESNQLSQFSIIKAPAVTTRGEATTNCDDIGTMTLSDLLSKNFLLETFNISTSDAAHTALASFRKWDFPTAVAKSKQFASIFRNYQYARFDVQLKFVLSGSVQQTGLFCATVVPHNIAKTVVPTSTLTTYAGLAHPLAGNYCLMRPNKESMAVIDIPYISNRNFMEDNRINTAGGSETYARWYDIYSSVHFNILIPLASSTTGATSCTVSVYASITNLRADVMAIPQMFDTISNVSIDKMRDSTLPVNMTGQSLDLKASVPFLMDKPSDTRNFEPMLMKSYQNLVNSKSTVVAHRMTLNGSDVNLMDTSCFKTDNNAMSLDAFKNTYFTQWVESVTDKIPRTKVWTWSASTPSGSLIGSFPVSLSGLRALGGDRTVATSTFATAAGWNANGAPFIASMGSMGFTEGPDFAPTDNKDFERHSVHSYLSRQFHYWNGTMKYRLYMASNMFYNGKLFVHVAYGTSPLPLTISPTGDDPRTTYGFELNANSECAYYDFEVPFRHPCKMADVHESIAYIGIYVDQPLKANNGMPSSLQFAMYRAWGEDMVVSDYSPYPYMACAGEINGQGENLEMCGSYRAVQKRPLKGCIGVDRFISVKQLITVPWHIGNFCSPAGGYDRAMYVINLNKLHELGFFRYFGGWYAGYKGSLRLILRFNNLANPLRLQYYTTPSMMYTHGASSGTGDSGSWVRSLMDHAGSPTYLPSNNYLFDLENAANTDIQSLSGTDKLTFESTWRPVMRGQTQQMRSVWVGADNPETVIELPFRHNKTYAKTYAIFNNFGYLAIYNPNFFPAQTNWNINFEMSMVAGDDFQFILPVFSRVGLGFDDGNFIPTPGAPTSQPLNFPPNVKIIDQYTINTAIDNRGDISIRSTDRTEYGVSEMPPLRQTAVATED